MGRPCPGSCSGSSIRVPSTGWRTACPRAELWSPPRMERRRRRRWPHGSWGPRSGSRTIVRARTSSRGLPPLSWLPGTRSSASSRWTRRLCPRSCGGCGRVLSASETCSATSSTATASSSCSPSGGGRRSRRFRRPRHSSSTATTRRAATSPPAAVGRLSSGSTTNGTPRRSSSTRRTRSGASAAGRPTPTRRPTSGTSATTAARVAGTRGLLWTLLLARSS